MLVVNMVEVVALVLHERVMYIYMRAKTSALKREYSYNVSIVLGTQYVEAVSILAPSSFSEGR